MNFLLIHGVGHKEANGSWDAEWQDTISSALKGINANIPFKFDKLPYDTMFAESELDAAVVAEATARLLASGVWHGIGDLLTSRGFGDVLRWTAGMVAQWAADEELRDKCRKALEKQIATFKPDVICAHSLGSLIAYDTFARNPAIMAGKTFVSLGSQIGNPFVRSIFGGRLEPLGTKARWFHLYNEEDNVLTAEIRFSAPNFEQVNTFFDIPGYADHDPVRYLSHPNTVDRVWRNITTPQPANLSRALSSLKSATSKPERRALLVGINDYPNPADRLEGCVNDVYRMSEVLQELGFEPENIRVVLDDRATASGIRERLEWLLDGAEDGDHRFFFYSGHGAQLPGYGGKGEVDHTDECLVPFDFDWTKERAITDDWFCQLYSQLPYNANFIGVLDCCHSGGMTRNGSLRVRGLNPPDDIRHRSLRWDVATQMWIPRELALSRKNLVDGKDDRGEYVGRSGATRRLGRAVPLWTSAANYRKAKKAYGHNGPYVPILLEACQESEYSYEYRHGVTSFGAFTYCLTTIFRKMRGSKKPVSWDKLMKLTTRQLHQLKYQQTPLLICPGSKRDSSIFKP
jgi:hypothetical protein